MACKAPKKIFPFIFSSVFFVEKMSFWILLLPVLVNASIGSTRQTICRRIERIAGYIVDAQTHIETSEVHLANKQRLFFEMVCHRFDLVTTGVNFNARWAHKINEEMSEENFVLNYRSYPAGLQQLHCVVLKYSIESHSSKLERRIVSLANLELLKPEYEKLLVTFDQTERIDDPKWNRVLEIAELYERYQRGVKSMFSQLHDFLGSKSLWEKAGQMFWAPEETPRVIGDVVDTIMREEDDAEKLRICLEMILKTQTMSRWNLHVLVKGMLDKYKKEMTAIGTDLLNAEREILTRFV